MEKSFFIDTTLCTACRACQVACKQWHDLPAEKTKNNGTFQNPPDLSFNTYKLVRMKEEIIDNKLKWLFFPEQCRHCIEAPCLETAENPEAIYRDPATGAIIFTAKTRDLDIDDIIDSCPYSIPRKGSEGILAKCDMCNDRVHNGLKPACVATCPTGAMTFGNRDEILSLAKKRLLDIQKSLPNSTLIDAEDVSVIYLVSHDPALYYEYAVAARQHGMGMTRKAALKKMFKPFTSLMRV